jgi:tetratricopeptide (TPR) repeat protein
MAEVFTAEDSATGEEHALKIMVRGSPHAGRFNQEYEALTRLNHAGIVRVYQYGVHRSAPWFSMELVAGEPLQQWMKRVGKPGTPARTQEVMRAGAFIADAVAYIHGRGLIHRDLKGNNVLMLPDGRVKLLDFGTAHIRDGLRQLTKPGEFIGTLAYASPEQFRGKAIDHRVDLYALGVLLYRMVTGHRPFAANDPASLARLIARSKPRPPSEVIPDLPPGLEELILQLLAKRPGERPENAREVADRLEDLIGEPLGLPGWGAVARIDRMTAREDVVRTLRRLVDAPASTVLLLGQAGSDRERIVSTLIADARRDGELGLQAFLRSDPSATGLVDMLLQAAENLDTVEDRRVTAAIDALKLMRQRGLDITLRNRAGLEAAAVSTLVGLARIRGEILIAVHDADQAEPPTLDLLGRLHAVVARGSLPVRFLLTAEQGRGESERRILQRIPDARRVALAPLSVAQVALKVGAMLDRRPPPTALARSIHEASGGQPLWVEAVVNQLVEHRAIRLIGEDGNRIEWVVSGDLEVPDAAMESLLHDVLALPALQRRVLFATAAAGPPVPLPVLAAALGWPRASLLIILKELVREGWLRVEDSLIRFTQPLLRRLLPTVVSEERNSLLRAALADVVLEVPARREHIELLLASDRAEDAVRRAIAGANESLDELATVDALEMVDLIAPLAKDPGDVDHEILAQALLLHANCLLMIRPVDPALAGSLSAARKLARTEATQIGVLLARARLQRTLGHLVNHSKQLKAAWSKAEALGEPRLKSIVASFQAEALRLEGRMRDAGRWVDIAVETAAEADETAVAYAQVAEAALAVAQGRFGDAEPLLREAMSAFEASGNHRGLWTALPTLVPILRLQGRFTEALIALYEQLPVARRCQEPIHTVRLLLATAATEADLNRLGRAQEHIDEIDTLVRRGEQLDVRLASAVVRGRILLASGHLRPALKSLEDAHERARAAGLPAISELARALVAETLHEMDDERGAKDLFASALLGLLGAGDSVALVEGTLARLRALGGAESSDKITRPIQEILNRGALAVVAIECLLADAAYHSANNQRADARADALEAQARLDELAEHLADTDRAALRLHAWSRRIRAILK